MFGRHVKGGSVRGTSGCRTESGGRGWGLPGGFMWVQQTACMMQGVCHFNSPEMQK